MFNSFQVNTNHITNRKTEAFIMEDRPKANIGMFFIAEMCRFCSLVF